MLYNLLLHHEPLLSEVRQEWVDHFLSLEFNEGKARELIFYLLTEKDPNIQEGDVEVEFVDSPIHAQKLVNKNPAIRESMINFNGSSLRLHQSAQNHLVNWLIEAIFTDHKKGILRQLDCFIDTYFSQWPDLLCDIDDVSLVKDDIIEKLLPDVVRDVSKQVYNHLKLMGPAMPFFPFWSANVFSGLRNRILNPRVVDIGDGPSFAHPVVHGDVSDFEWVSFYDGLQRAGLVEVEGLSYYIGLVKANVFFWTPTCGCSIVCRPPEIIKFDDRDRLHCVDGPAVKFRDGHGQFWIHGVNFDKKIFEWFFSGKKRSPEDILELPNVEHRIALIQHFGPEYIFDHISDKALIARDECVSAVTGNPVTCELYDCFMRQVGEIRLLKLEDHTTHKPVVLAVPSTPETMTCKGAIAWTFGMSQEEYKLDFES